MSPARFVAALLLVPVICLRVGGPRPAGSSRSASGPAMLATMEPLASVVTPFGPAQEGQLKVMIAGGGIGGLCTALVLQNQGHDVHIYEKTSSYRPFGGPIQIASNALESLKRIDQGVYDAILAKATSIGTRKNGLKDGVSNEWFATFDLMAPARRRGQDSSVVIDRPILQEILLEVRQHGQNALARHRPNSAPAPPQGAPGGSGRLDTLRELAASKIRLPPLCFDGCRASAASGPSPTGARSSGTRSTNTRAPVTA